MNSAKKTYTDISGIIAAKQERRRALAALSWEKKVEIVDRMRHTMVKNKWNSSDKDT